MILKFQEPRINVEGTPNKPDKFFWVGEVVKFYHEVIDIPVNKDYYRPGIDHIVFRYGDQKDQQILRLVIYTKNNAGPIFFTTEARVFVISNDGKTIETLYPCHK